MYRILVGRLGVRKPAPQAAPALQPPIQFDTQFDSGSRLYVNLLCLSLSLSPSLRNGRGIGGLENAMIFDAARSGYAGWMQAGPALAATGLKTAPAAVGRALSVGCTRALRKGTNQMESALMVSPRGSGGGGGGCGGGDGSFNMRHDVSGI